MPPEGFTALFNGKDLTGWHTPPEVLENWFLEDGVLKSPGLVEHYRASVLTKELYRDFILMFEFRIPTISDRSNFLRCSTESSCSGENCTGHKPHEGTPRHQSDDTAEFSL